MVVVLDPGAAFAHLPAEVRDPMLELTDVWSGNAEEAADLLAALGRPLADDADSMAAPARALAPLLRGEAVTIVRDGPAGCAVTVGGETTLLPGYPQTPVDTNGAGDTHTGALVADVAAWLDSLANQKGYSNPYFSSSTESLIGPRTVVDFESTATLNADALSGAYTAPAGG